VTKTVLARRAVVNVSKITKTSKFFFAFPWRAETMWQHTFRYQLLVNAFPKDNIRNSQIERPWRTWKSSEMCIDYTLQPYSLAIVSTAWLCFLFAPFVKCFFQVVNIYLRHDTLLYVCDCQFSTIFALFLSIFITFSLTSSLQL